MGLDNENPLILSASELPTRKQRRKNKEASSKQHIVKDLLNAKLCSADPFDLSDTSNSDSDDSVEPIDEMEIYGKLSPLEGFHLVASLSFLSVELCLVASGIVILCGFQPRCFKQCHACFCCSCRRNWREWGFVDLTTDVS